MYYVVHYSLTIHFVGVYMTYLAIFEGQPNCVLFSRRIILYFITQVVLGQNNEYYFVRYQCHDQFYNKLV